MNQKRRGIIISYLNLIMGMVVNIFLTPFLIVSLGDVDYSLYKVMHSFAGPLTMFHLGISTVVTRSIVKYKNSEEYTIRDKKNTMALALMASVAMSMIVIVIGAIMYTRIPSMYGQTYSSVSIQVGQRIFIIFVLSSVLHMLTDAFSGCILGHECYIVSSLIPLIKTVSKCILMIVLLKCQMGVVGVVAVDLILALGVFTFSLFYAVFVLREIPRLTFFDKKQIMEILSFGLAILLQAFVNQVNNNVDTMILGAYVEEKFIITMYSSALAIYSIYNSLISVVTHYFLPQATKLTTQNASGKELTDFIIKPGRFQAMVAVACICGFILFGKNFITIWIGPRYLDAYGVILLLMIPVTIPLVENAAISILDATMKRIYRSIVLVIMAIINVIMSICLVQQIGFWGAAIGTACSLIIGHGFLMNLYYAREFKIEVFRMFGSIFYGILPAGLVSVLTCTPLSLYLPNTIVWFVLKCLCFIIVYGLYLYWFGINKDEKAFIRGVVKKYRNKL